jgi:AcrR family transcriptional regulator
VARASYGLNRKSHDGMQQQKISQVQILRMLMSPVALSPAQRRKETQRERIIAEAVRLFQENGGEKGGGFDVTTIESIAERADISVRTFHRYFDSKADVIYLDTERQLEDLREKIVERLEIDLPLRAVIKAQLEILEKFVRNPVNRSRLALALKSKNFEQRYGHWLKLKRELVTQILLAYVSKDAAGYRRASMLAQFCVSVVDSAMAAWAEFPKSDLLELVDEAAKSLEPILQEYEIGTRLPATDGRTRAY